MRARTATESDVLRYQIDKGYRHFWTRRKMRPPPVSNMLDVYTLVLMTDWATRHRISAL